MADTDLTDAPVTAMRRAAEQLREVASRETPGGYLEALNSALAVLFESLGNRAEIEHRLGVGKPPSAIQVAAYGAALALLGESSDV